MIVVLGASGRTGRVVVTLSRGKGSGVVRAVTRDAARIPAAPGVEVAVARLSDDVELGRALRGAQALFALLPDDLSAPHFHAQRREMAAAIARAIRRQRVPRVVLLSSPLAALGEQGQNGLGRELAYFERVVLETEAATCILRASYFQDNVVAVLPTAERDGVYPNLIGPSAITTIAAADVAFFAARALREPAGREREQVDLLGPVYSPAQIAAALAQAVGRQVSVLDVPAASRGEELRRWMSAEAAQAMSETLDCLASGRLDSDAVRRDRVEHGTTRLDQVLRDARPRAAASAAQAAVGT